MLKNVSKSNFWDWSKNIHEEHTNSKSNNKKERINHYKL